MASPFGSQLGTNYCPKDDEVLEIQALLVEPTRRLKSLDDEIAQLQKAIAKLTDQRDRLSAFVDSHKALISPVRRLPLDIIQEIFIAGPVLLGRICASWRAISLVTPRLWARLHIVEPPRGRYGASNALIDDKVAQRLGIAKMWLGRSGQCPLSISLQSGPDYDSPPATPTTSQTRSGQFLEELIPFAGRWQHVRFTTPPFVLESIAHLTAEDVPMLESAAFHPQLQFPPRVVNWDRYGMLGGPRLESFSTTGNSFNPPSLPLRWHQLTELSIGGPAWETSLTSDAILVTLAQCPQLRTCSLVVNDGGPSSLLPGAYPVHPLVELPSLRTFQLDCGSISCSVLDRLSLPQLRDFTLHGINDHSLASFFGLCTRLESVRIDSNTFSKATLQDSLRALPPTMRHLTIRDITHGPSEVPLVASLDDEALTVLTPTYGMTTVPCPGLQTLTILRCCLISDAALLRFVTARMALALASDAESGSTLQRVDIQFNRSMTLDIMPRLAPLMVETGLDVVVSYVNVLTTHFSPWQGLADAPSPQWVFPGAW
ncbi:hypothetical protein K438DRAFT_1786124 [Mycena galopus ATCC 62051]|nr:hypothetical protein K438DRAFT_1786124 [Mycena galopus ATCC 62051]